MLEKPEYIKCIAHSRSNQSWCGRNISMEFHFQDLDHAAEYGDQKGRLVACPECVAAIVVALNNGRE